VRSATTAALAPGGAAQAEVDVWAYVGYSSDVVDLYVTATPSSPVWTLIGSRTATKAGAQTIIVPFILPSASGPRFAIRAQFRYLGSASSCTSGPYNDRDDLVFTVAGGGGSSGLINGGFESGLASWSGAGSVSADTTAGLSHSGASHAVLRAQYGAPAALTQSFTVPAGVTTLTLYARPETATTTVLDVSLRVTLAASGVAILDSAVASNLTNPGTWSPISLDVTRFAGTNATLTLRSDSNVISSSEFFRVDDVSLH
jgi:hypothetical protein